MAAGIDFKLKYFFYIKKRLQRELSSGPEKKRLKLKKKGKIACFLGGQETMDTLYPC